MGPEVSKKISMLWHFGSAGSIGCHSLAAASNLVVAGGSETAFGSNPSHLVLVLDVDTTYGEMDISGVLLPRPPGGFCPYNPPSVVHRMGKTNRCPSTCGSSPHTSKPVFSVKSLLMRFGEGAQDLENGDDPKYAEDDGVPKSPECKSPADAKRTLVSLSPWLSSSLFSVQKDPC